MYQSIACAINYGRAVDARGSVGAVQAKRVQAAVGDRVRGLRKDRGWTIERLAAEAGLATSFVTNVELGKQSPSVVVLAKLARALDVQVSAVVDVLDGDAAALRASLTKRAARLDVEELRLLLRVLAMIEAAHGTAPRSSRKRGSPRKG